MPHNTNGTPDHSRRRFLFQMSAAGASMGALGDWALGSLDQLKPTIITNPLFNYPNRNWERVYRDLYRSDSKFTFLCAPNDTHNCLMWAHVKNGVVTRISPTYGYSKATDLNGNKASHAWDPRCCQKGLALVRRFYGDRRCKRPLVRSGFKQWIDDGMPRDPNTGAVDADRYLNRGVDGFVEVTFEEAFELSAKAMVNIARTYTGEAGTQRLLDQGYDPLMVETTQGAGTQVMKFRGGMPPLGMTRIFAQYREANAMALLDDTIRGGGNESSLGGRGWDNYSWHTDLPPGHPMVTGQQTVDFDLCNAEHAGLLIAWGMNWITTKMPDAHWMTEARMKGTKVVVIAAEYGATSSKADEVIVVRPGTTPALALSLARTIIDENLYDDAYVKANTDLPMLVRLDDGQMLRASDVFPDYQLAELTNNIIVTEAGQNGPPIHNQPGPVVSRAKREEWGDYVMWNADTDAPVPVSRDLVAGRFPANDINPNLEGEYTVTLADGSEVQCQTVFTATRKMLDDSYTPEQAARITAPAEAIRGLARQIAANMDRTLFVCGMGPNQFFNSDLKDRAIFLLAALTRNVGKIGGNVGSYAGNYRASFFNGLGQYIAENPFDVELDPKKPARSKRFWKPESVHYFNHGDSILRMGGKSLTGKTHLPTPSKSIHVSNSNSLIGNAKGHYDSIVNIFRKVEFIAINEWWWTASCEYSDVVFPVDSWAEMKYPDMSISVTNPFLYVFPATPLKRIHNTRSDLEVAQGICEAIGRETNDDRHADYWKFINRTDGARPYIQRILDHSNACRGYKIDELEIKANQGIPAILQTRTYPKVGAWEQGTEGKPYYTKTGRLEFYREEPEFMDSGENLVVHREPIDSTFYEPNVIVAADHPLLRPKSPEDYGVERSDISGDARQARHVILTVDEMLKTEHPLRKDGYEFIFHTPKYRHGAHTTAVDTDIVAVWFGPFGDMYRRDKRSPFINEMYVDINPLDAKKNGIEDGDYVWIDADPHDRPFRDWQNNPRWYKVARLMARARYYPGTPRGVTRMWHNMYGSTYGSVRGSETNANGLAKSPETNYQSLFRTGSHQSCTRGWLKPTWMTDSLTVKGLLGQKMTQGFVPDVHCPTGAPRESFVKITKAEDGGYDGVGLWHPAEIGFRPTYESDTLNRFIAGEFAVRHT